MISREDAERSRRIGRRPLCAALFSAATATPSLAQDVEADALLISNAWFQPLDSPPRSARAFVSVRNRATEPDRLLYAWSLEAGIVELREAAAPGKEGRVAVEGLAIPPNGSLVLTPDGPHLALREITPDLRPTDDVRIALRFAMTGGILVSFRPRAA